MNWINTYPFGWGYIRSSGTGADGVRYWYAAFAGFGVHRISPRHVAGHSEKTFFAHFSNN